MARGLPDYYNPDTLISQRLANVEEIVTMSRGFASVDNRGRALLFDKFEQAGAAWISATSGDGSNPVLSDTTCYVRPKSIKFDAGTLSGSGISWMVKRVMLGVTARLGLETAIVYDTLACTYRIAITYNLGGNETLAELRILPPSGDIAVWTLSKWVTVGNVGFNAGSAVTWIPIKLVADFESDFYLRLIVGQEDIDLSFKTLGATAVDQPGLAEFVLKAVADDDVSNNAYYGYAIITVDEP